MPEVPHVFKCLRCGHETRGMSDPKKVKELTCPKCRSNSVRRIPEKQETS